jgi:apolipoprotein N-acyltransferase
MKIPEPQPSPTGEGSPLESEFIRSFFINLGLTAFSVLLFAGSFPNLLFERGLPFLAWIAYAPIFILLHRVSLGASVFWGCLHGYASYTLFNYWLAAFHPLAGLIVGCMFFVYNAVLFFFLRLALILFPKRAFLVQWVLWMAYEYLRTKGFLGYSYGVTGYSQWRVIPLIQIANIFGVWGVSALVVFPSIWLAPAAQFFREFSRKDAKDAKDAKGRGEAGSREQGAGSKEEGRDKKESRDAHQKQPLLSPFAFFAPLRPLREVFSGKSAPKAPASGLLISFFVWLAALIASLIYGFVQPTDFSVEKQVRIALIQHNTDPWKGGIEEYKDNLVVLKRLSNEALATEPRPDMVVWSETAFVPRIYWHETYRDDHSSWLLVRELMEYLSAQEVPFLIGNDDARKDPAKNPNAKEGHRVDYNAAILFEKGRETGIYRKLHLVPFTEYFPYQKQFPSIHRALLNADTHFWEKGTEAKVFDGPGFTFSTPICFEDTFGYLSRKFAQNGAQIIINMSNDAWSRSLPAQNQHLSMAVFRAVENRRSLVRATSSGQTCGITPNGRVLAMAKPFTEAALVVAIPVVKGDTVYIRWGDFLAVGFTVAAVFLLLFGTIAHIIRKHGKAGRVLDGLETKRR